ncbi:F-box protein CPR1-like [Vicia villosa]|uniref:F-box protein CPR1-like n=1 Tax=Vicia villosa TaxID=3911 RepID=UPI00273B93E0|nr:F-box protein CPR1-like [Vicia villosa]
METLTLPSLPTFSHEDSLPMDLVVESLPMDLVVEILCRLPVKFLLQFRSVCKLWNSLISGHNFAKKHLHLSATRSLNYVFYFDYFSRFILESRPLDSVFSTMFMDVVTQIDYSLKGFDGGFHNYPCNFVGSCNGILCLARLHHDCFVRVWNPSIRKFKELPPLIQSKFNNGLAGGWISHGFGYDHVNDNYKVVAVVKYAAPRRGRQGCSISKTQVGVYTFGTDLWKSIGEFPFGSFHLVVPRVGNQGHSYVPDYGEVDEYNLNLGVLRDCLCVFSDYGVWLMKEYGNKESWTKLFTISYEQEDPSDSYFLANVICMFADDQVLLESSSNCGKKMTSYDLKTGTYKFINFQNKIVNNPWKWNLEVCSESLILP